MSNCKHPTVIAGIKCLQCEIERLKEENNCYRKALERIAQEAEYLDGNGRQCGDIAMDALEEVKDE